MPMKSREQGKPPATITVEVGEVEGVEGVGRGTSLARGLMVASWRAPLKQRWTGDYRYFRRGSPSRRAHSRAAHLAT
jgi:hypothetical protein